MLRRFTRAQEGKLRHQRDVVAEAGELGTLAAVLAMMKKVCPAKGAEPSLGTRRRCSRNASWPDSRRKPTCRRACNGRKCDPLDCTTGWALRNAVEQGALQGGQPVRV